jgi:membrane-associated phospholipid phosphatase
MRRDLVTLCFAASAALAPACAWCDSESERRAGDVLSYALPAATLGAELLRGERTGALQFGESFALALAATEVLKRTTHVERPDRSDDQSFPSGHATRAFAAATYVHRRHGFGYALPLYAVATYVGYTRVQSDRHRWADVVGAAGVSAAASWWLVKPRSAAGAPVAVIPGGIFLQWTVPLR